MVTKDNINWLNYVMRNNAIFSAFGSLISLNIGEIESIEFPLEFPSEITLYLIFDFNQNKIKEDVLPLKYKSRNYKKIKLELSFETGIVLNIKLNFEDRLEFSNIAIEHKEGVYYFTASNSIEEILCLKANYVDLINFNGLE